MSDEPGTAPADAQGADLMLRLVAGMDPTSADGRAGMRAILRELEAMCPGALQRIITANDARKVRSGRVTIQ